jgi:hypothetical protein
MQYKSNDAEEIKKGDESIQMQYNTIDSEVWAKTLLSIFFLRVRNPAFS